MAFKSAKYINNKTPQRNRMHNRFLMSMWISLEVDTFHWFLEFPSRVQEMSKTGKCPAGPRHPPRNIQPVCSLVFWYFDRSNNGKPTRKQQYFPARIVEVLLQPGHHHRRSSTSYATRARVNFTQRGTEVQCNSVNKMYMHMYGLSSAPSSGHGLRS